MNKKTLVILIVSAAVLITGIAAGVMFLYSDKGGKGKKAVPERFIENNKLIKAVPSDAAIVFCVKNFGRAREYVNDSTTVFNQILSKKFERLMKESLPSLRKSPAILSVHYSEDLPPLLVIEDANAIADTTADLKKLLRAADSSGLFTRINGDLIIISSSETIVNSSIRHINEGHSVLESSGFSELTSEVQGEDVVFVSNAYTENLMKACFAKKLRLHTAFIKELSSWTAFTITSHSAKGLQMQARLWYDNEPSYYLNVTHHAGPSAVSVADVVPSQVDFVLDLPIGDITSYIKAFRNYLDAKARLDKYERTLSDQKNEKGENAEEWAKSLNIKEVAIADIRFGKSARQLLLIKPDAKRTAGEGIKDYPYSGFAKTLFGEIFTGEDETSRALVNGWIVVGNADCVEEYAKTYSESETLKSFLSRNGLSDRIPQKDCGGFLYFSFSEDPDIIDAAFSPSMAKACGNIPKGVGFAPLTIAAISEGEKEILSFNVDRTDFPNANASSASRDTSVAVPAGPFKVKNSFTGKTNTFFQNSRLSLCLQDENGKDVWGIPFKEPVLGYVQEIDYFNNGKLQYLFAAGSKLYLIDRLGRFVSGFPVETGKKIAVGPMVYDFTGAKGYTVMVLHKDNSVGMCDLHGKKPSFWKGITSEETIKRLPELLKGKDNKYWIVRTSNQTLIFPFEGGDPVVKGEGNKMILPDSEIKINDKGLFCAKCYDGKDRAFKSGQ